MEPISTTVDAEWEWQAADWMIRVHLACWVQLAGYPELGAWLAALPELTGPESWQAQQATILKICQTIRTEFEFAEPSSEARLERWDAIWALPWYQDGSAQLLETLDQRAVSGLGIAAWGLAMTAQETAQQAAQMALYRAVDAPALLEKARARQAESLAALYARHG